MKFVKTEYPTGVGLSISRREKTVAYLGILMAVCMVALSLFVSLINGAYEGLEVLVAVVCVFWLPLYNGDV